MPNFTPDGKRNQLFGFAVGIALFLILSVGAFIGIFNERLYPGIVIDDIPVGGLTKKEAWSLLQQKLGPLEESTIIIKVDDISVASSSGQLGLTRNYESALDQAYSIGRSGTVLQRVVDTGKLMTTKRELHVPITFDDAAAKRLINELEQKVNIPGEDPKAVIGTSRVTSSIEIHPGFIGRQVDVGQTRISLSDAINQRTFELQAPVSSVGAQLTEEQIAQARSRTEQLVGKRLIVRAPNIRIEISDDHLVEFLQFPEGVKQESVALAVDSWVEFVNRPAENAEFQYDQDTLKVQTFKPHREGLSLNREASKAKVVEAFSQLANSEKVKPGTLGEYQDTEVELVVETSQPEITLAETNDLGIAERIGLGESEYDHSIPNRIHNVAITAERVNNILVPPGAEFSFNKTLGEVSAATGYKSAYVIRNGKTELGDGGGVCQVSTTVFRAVLSAGLEVTRRLPHSYRVSYYELNAKPGIDATVYAGEIDFRFKNDTNHHILIQTQADSENLYMTTEIYGTSDGRTSEIINHETWDYRPAPPPQFYPDPSLRPGQRRQIDWAVAGVKARFTNVVKDKNGNLIRENTYTSNYRPWSAKYLIGV